MANQVMNAAVCEGGNSSKISYYVQSRLETLAVMIEHARKKDSKQTAAGIKAIFSGVDDDAGMAAAQLLADILDLPLQHIDMSELYGQYCGEAENYLEQVLDRAQACQAIVVFDRLDGLFGYGPNVSTAHEHHVQLDVGYFLKTLAGYQLSAILRTRAYHRLDLAIMRQFACVIDLDDGMLPVQRRA